MKPLTHEQIAGVLAQLAGKPVVDARDLLGRLAAPFPAEVVSWRVGPTTKDKKKGIALAYIDARDVMDRLDDVMGADWQCDYTAMPDGSYCCRIGLLIDGEWRWRSDGAVMITDSDNADAREMAQKGSYSDAFKRAAVRWGVGRYLYDVPSPWVDLDERRSIVAAAMPKLRSLLNRHAAAAREEARQVTREPRGEEPAETPERGAAAGAADAQPSAAAAPAPARKSAAKPAAKPNGEARPVVEPAGPATAEALLTGIMQTPNQVAREGLRDICRRIVAATNNLDPKKRDPLPGKWTPDQYTVESLNAAYAQWEAWQRVMAPKLSEEDGKKVLDAMDAYSKAAKKLDAAVAKRAKAAEAEGADPDSGELVYEPSEESA